MSSRLRERGRETCGARIGKHDDLIRALGLAIWAAEEEVIGAAL
jgi:hypothetical protein